MKVWKSSRRVLIVAGTAALLAGCQVIPRGPTTSTPGPAPAPAPTPTETGLPSDESRHRVALLVPLSGENGAVGQSIANATTMALLDTNADNLRITTYDTARGAREAARQAVTDGNKLILGPLLAREVGEVQAATRGADLPLITFSNDTSVAGPGVFVMGHLPDQSIARTVTYARGRGSTNFAAIVPEGEYGERAAAALRTAVVASGGRMIASETYARGNTSVVSAAQRLRQRGGFDTVLIADGARIAALAAAEFRPRGTGTTQLLGTELWSGESALTRTSAFRGAWFSAVSDARYKRFADSYADRFGGQPYRISTLGYDAVLLALRVARNWRVGRDFPVAQLRDSGGFLGLDGAFRFDRSGVVDRAMEVREVREGQVVIVSPAPARFDD